jgi:hypothetical protein
MQSSGDGVDYEATGGALVFLALFVSVSSSGKRSNGYATT